MGGAKPFRYEHRGQHPITRKYFAHRLLLHFAVAIALVGVSLGLGMLGYVYFEHLTWLDAFLNAAMLLGGMGPVNMPMSPGGKLFSGVYALFSGLVFLVVAGIMLGPVAHRLLHHFHWEMKE
jgi:hypothetical protein